MTSHEAKLKELQKENDDLKRERDELLARLELPPRPDRITYTDESTAKLLVWAFSTPQAIPSYLATHPDIIIHAGAKFSCDVFHFTLRNDVRIRQNCVIDSLVLDPVETQQ